MPSTITDITAQISELENKALAFIADAEAPVTDYVAKVAETLAGYLPEDKPELVNQGIDALVGQVDFVKKVLDAQVDFVKSVLDAVTKPVRPAPVAKAKTVKAA